MNYCFVYDGSFEGFLTAVYEAYRLRLPVNSFVSKIRYVPDLLSETYEVETVAETAERVWNKVLKMGGNSIGGLLFAAFLSELPEVEWKIWLYFRKLFSKEGKSFAKNPISEEAMPLIRIANSVKRERDRIHGFLRFQKLEENLFFAGIEPEYQIIPLITNHFVKRFPHFSWIIWDVNRKKGIFFDQKNVEEITIDGFQMPRLEDDFCAMWKSYYRSAFIQERKNGPLLRRLLPQRYWAQMPERASLA